ncbi:hypothetical protein ACJMPS_004862, partial [Salmonella enterica subsp. enterica serovar Newport]
MIFLRNRNARRSHATGRSTRAGEEAEDPLNRMMSNYALWPHFFSAGYSESRIPPLKRVQFFTKSAWQILAPDIRTLAP